MQPCQDTGNFCHAPTAPFCDRDVGKDVASGKITGGYVVIWQKKPIDSIS